ncbi:MAG: cation-transporting P-type ATPase [Bradyrhizobium sp.]|nr:cation-transporting P-type ATPase [Bradyrhizobium sp.]
MQVAANPPEAERISVTPVHTSVLGRVRFRVVGLRDGPTLARTLERGLLAAPGVTQASASPTTGNVLVLHDGSSSIPELAERIGALLRGEIAVEGANASPYPWHAMEVEEVAQVLGTSQERGLSNKEGKRRLLSDGANSIPSLHSRSDWSMFIEQFQGLPVALLAGAAALSLATGGLLEAGTILAVVGLNAAIGFGVEKRTEQTISSLGAPSVKHARVMRGSVETEVASAALVRGDIMVLQRGSVVPADGRLLRSDRLMVSEAALTGESQPVEKSADPLADLSVTLADRSNMVYRGTIVTGGGGTALVVATGRDTEMGRVQQLVGATAPPETPTMRQMRELGQQLVWVTLGATGLIFGVGLVRGLALVQLVRSSLAVAVAAVPEGLPVVATTTLALGVEKMRRHGILVRRLEAIETLASVNVICFDKTGTLTRGTMSLEVVAIGNQLWRSRNGVLEAGEVPGGAGGSPLARLLSIVSLCSDAKVCRNEGEIEINGSSTEAALVQAALANGVDVLKLHQDYPRRSVQQRTEAYRFMVSYHEAPRGFLVAMKGSPAEVLARCEWELHSTRARKLLTPARRSEIEALNHQLAEEGLRVLGVACVERRKSVESGELDAAEVGKLVWTGLVALSDPVRPDVQSLMQKLHRAGIHTVMLTGDQRCTAEKIGGEVRLSGDAAMEVIDGTELDRLGSVDFARVARRAHAFARVTPSQKLKIVQALQHSGAVVAMVGDGINDSPALRAANVGIAIGRNEDAAAREVADIYLANDRLGMLPLAVASGRATYTNVRKALHYILSTNASEVLLVLAATGMGITEILTPVQLLWINLVSDVLPGIGLAVAEPEANVMDYAPVAANEPILRTSDFARLAKEAGLITAGAFGTGLLGAARYGFASSQMSTMTFGSLVSGQLLHALTYANTGAGTSLGPPAFNPALLGIVGGSLVLQAVAMVVPGLSSMLGVTRIGASDAAAIVAGAVLPYLANSALGSGRPSSSLEEPSMNERSADLSSEQGAEQVAEKRGVAKRVRPAGAKGSRRIHPSRQVPIRRRTGASSS